LELLSFRGFKVMYVQSLRKEGTKVFDTFNRDIRKELGPKK